MAPLQLVEVSLRAGQQALLVSRLRQRHAVPVAEQLDRCGFWALDVFGGTTFEAAIRFLGEHPFERLRAIRRAAPNTRLLASLSGQALVAHRHVADDVVEAFVGLIAGAGIDVLRVADPLNDARNLRHIVGVAKRRSLHVEGTVICSDAMADSESVVAIGTQLAELECDSLCLHDPLGVVGVAQSVSLSRALRAATSLPLGLSFAAQTGQADYAYLAGVEHGCERIDVALSPLAGGASVPAAEATIAALRDTPHDTGIELDTVAGAALVLEGQLVHYAEVVDPLATRLDMAALRGLLPPSAMGHALTELRDRDALERVLEVEEEASRVRRELGSPPLVTPLAEVIATQAVYNVCDGDRYATVSQEVKDYCLGLYGTAPKAIDEQVAALVNGREQPITMRPADLLDPQLPEARQSLEREQLDASDEEAVVCHALFPEEWLTLARHQIEIERLGDEPAPAATPTPTGVGSEDEAEPSPEEPPLEVRDLTVEVDGQSYTVRVFGQPGSFMTSGGGGQALVNAAASVGRPVVREGTVAAPMQGLILKVLVKPGDTVEMGQVVAVLEAMKMQNDVTAVRGGTVTDVYVKEGSVVAPRDPIAHIA